jgi:hypothetical protein
LTCLLWFSCRLETLDLCVEVILADVVVIFDVYILLREEPAWLMTATQAYLQTRHCRRRPWQNLAENWAGAPKLVVRCLQKWVETCF